MWPQITFMEGVGMSGEGKLKTASLAKSSTTPWGLQNIPLLLLFQALGQNREAATLQKGP